MTKITAYDELSSSIPQRKGDYTNVRGQQPKPNTRGWLPSVRAAIAKTPEDMIELIGDLPDRNVVDSMGESKRREIQLVVNQLLNFLTSPRCFKNASDQVAQKLQVLEVLRQFTQTNPTLITTQDKTRLEACLGELQSASN